MPTFLFILPKPSPRGPLVCKTLPRASARRGHDEHKRRADRRAVPRRTTSARRTKGWRSANLEKRRRGFWKGSAGQGQRLEWAHAQDAQGVGDGACSYGPQPQHGPRYPCQINVIKNQKETKVVVVIGLVSCECTRAALFLSAPRPLESEPLNYRKAGWAGALTVIGCAVR